MRDDGWVVCVFYTVAAVVVKDGRECFEIVGFEDGVGRVGGPVADAVEDLGGHQGAVEEGTLGLRCHCECLWIVSTMHLSGSFLRASD